MAEQFAAWGPKESGQRLAELDQAKLGLENMQALHAAGQVQMIPSQIAAQNAMAQFHSAEAATKIDALAANKRWQAGIDQLDTTDMTPQEYMSRIGIMGVQAGAPEAGRKLVDTASQLSLRQTTEALNRSRAAEQEALSIKHKGEQIGALASTVVDQPSLDRAIAIAQSQNMDTSQLPTVYNAQTAPMIAQIRDASIGAAKKADLQLREIEANRRLELASSRLETDVARRALLGAQTALDKIKEAQLAKEGGKKGAAIASPNSNELKQAASLLKEANIELEGGDATRAAFDVAARGKALARANPGLDTAQGMRRALAEAQQAGDYQTTPGGWLSSDTTKYVGGGKGPLTPFPSVPEKSKMIVGRYYKTPKGVMQWTKDGFVGTE